MESSTLKSRLLDKPGNCKNLYVGAAIPDKKLNKAIKAYAPTVKPDEVIALFDDTVFGSASDGFLITETCIADSWSKKRVDFNSIHSAYFYNGTLVLGNEHAIRPTLKSAIDLQWLARQLHEHLHTVYIQDKTLQELFAEMPVNGAGFHASSNLPKPLLDYLDGLAREVPEVGQLLPGKEIIAAISSPDFPESSSPEQEEIHFLTDNYLFCKNNGEEPHILPLNGILSGNLVSGGAVVKMLDGASYMINTGIDKNIFLPFFSVLLDYVDKYSYRDPQADINYFENLFHPQPESSSTGVAGGAGDLVANNPLFKMISLLNGKSVIIVAFLRNNAPEKVLAQLQKLPGVGLAAGVARVVLSRALNWLNNQIMKYGEAYMMNQLVANFRKRDITKAQLEKEINSSVYTILGDDIVEEALELLNKYMPDEEGALDQPQDEAKAVKAEGACEACGAANAPGSKFCSSCGAPLQREYKCANCGHTQATAMKFCPECGSPCKNLCSHFPINA